MFVEHIEENCKQILAGKPNKNDYLGDQGRERHTEMM
jgi:hypothetical protein